MEFDLATRRALLLTLAIALAPLLLQLPGQLAAQSIITVVAFPVECAPQ